VRLVDSLRPLERCAVAFSGGVDSAVVAAAAHRALGSNAVAVTGTGPSFADNELKTAQRVAKAIGIRHRLVQTSEIQAEAYRRNDGQRCFHCKSELYARIADLGCEEGFETILSGTNRDDLSDYRPGLRAAQEAAVRHPLAEIGLDKAAVRAIARHWNLDVWDKPATPCLASRIAYGLEVTSERLARIEAAESYLRRLGFNPLRVRLHPGDLARIEVGPEQVARLCAEPLRSDVTRHLRGWGFRFVAVDLAGLQTGGLNGLLQLESASQKGLNHGRGATG
jgi:uncharacterized protein